MSFTQEIQKFGQEAVGECQRVRKGVTIKLFSAVIMDTPVDTGRARANWQLTEGQPAQGALDDVSPNKAGLSMEEAQQIERTDGDGSLFLTNNLPYISKLEFDGYSKQAPDGMVRRNVVRFGQLIEVEVKNKT